MAKANPDEAYGGKLVKARPGALDAYRRMIAAARTEIGVRPPILSIASAYQGSGGRSGALCGRQLRQPGQGALLGAQDGTGLRHLPGQAGPERLFDRQRQPSIPYAGTSLPLAGE